MGKLLKGPLMVTIPLVALAMVVGIGIPIGILFIVVTNESSADATLIVAVIMTALVMAVAGFLSYRDYKNPQSADTRPVRPSRPRPEPQTGPRAPVTTRPARGKSRADGRRKSR